MKNNTHRNYAKENRNFQDELPKKNFKKSKLNDIFFRESKEFQNDEAPYNMHHHLPKGDRRSYNSVFDL